GIANWHRCSGPRTCISIIRRARRSENPSRGRRKVTAALFTRMSGAPTAPATSAKSRSLSSDWDRSAWTAMAFPPAATISSRVWISDPWYLGSGSIVRAASATVAPHSASRAAIALPRPRLPPVTRATIPSHRPALIVDLLRSRPASETASPHQRMPLSPVEGKPPPAQRVDRVAAPAGEYEQQEREAEQDRQRSAIARRWVGDGPRRLGLMHPEVGDRHFPRGDERDGAGEQSDRDEQARDDLDQSGIPAGPGSELDQNRRADRPIEKAPRPVRGKEQPVDEAKHAQRGRSVAGQAALETLRHDRHVTVAVQSSRRRHSRCRLDAMLWQCALSAKTTVVMSGLLRYRPASARGSGDTSTTPKPTSTGTSIRAACSATTPGIIAVPNTRGTTDLAVTESAATTSAGTSAR